MWRNYLLVAVRALAKSRTYAAINIAGLSLGIAACLLILTYVRYEFSYDAWLPGADRAAQFQTLYHAGPQGGEEFKSQTTPFVAGQALRKDFPQVEQVVFATSQNATYLRDGQASTADQTLLVDGNLFAVLHLPFVYGDPAHALDDPHSLTMSETEARKHFGPGNPVGRTITIVSGPMTAPYRLTGVYRDLPRNTSLHAGAIARADMLSYFASNPLMLTSWTNSTGGLYVRLRPGTDFGAINAALPAWEKRNIPDQPGQGPRSNPGDNTDWRLQPLRAIHLDGSRGPGTPGGDRQSVLTFGVVAALILAMACMNFTNLATARASQRAREVAVRKVLGATRRQLIVQFLGESLLVAGLATLLALALTELVIGPVNAFLRAGMRFHYWGRDGVLLPVLALTALVGVAGGLYPAVYLSRFQPARILKANKSAADAQGSGRLRNALVVAQFAVSIGLIICTAVVYAQTVYARTADAGYRRDGLLQVAGIDRPQAEAAMPTLLQQLRTTPGLLAVGRTNQGVNPGNNSTSDANRTGSRDSVDLGTYGIEPQAIEALGLRVLAGRAVSDKIARDDATTPVPVNLDAEKALVARGLNVVLSAAAAKRLGYATPQAAIGGQLEAGLTLPELGHVPATVVGVVNDVRYRSIREPVQPILYYYQTTGYNRLLVRFAGDPAAARAKVEAVWKRLLPEVPFDARFVDDIVSDLYDADETRAELFAGFALLAVVIGCLGLFGLAAFTAERRTKEIGIRKVLGARTADIVRLLVWQFSRPVLIANLLAWPAAWWIMRGWLNGFDDRVALTPVPFALAGGLALLIAVCTVAGHAVRVARTSPVRALRYE